MKIKCISTSGEYQPLVIPYLNGESISDQNFIISKEWYTIDSEISGYDITTSFVYEVYGLLFCGNELRYLILDDNGIPGFFPSGLFESAENNMQPDWEMNMFGSDRGRFFVIGYPELVSDYSELCDLISGKSSAIRSFLDYKESLSGWHDY